MPFCMKTSWGYEYGLETTLVTLAGTRISLTVKRSYPLSRPKSIFELWITGYKPLLHIAPTVAALYILSAISVSAIHAGGAV